MLIMHVKHIYIKCEEFYSIFIYIPQFDLKISAHSFTQEAEL